MNPHDEFDRHDTERVTPRRNGMPLCQCGHAWGDHAMPPHMDYDIDNGERWCYADYDQCPCKRYVADLMDALKRALPAAGRESGVPTPDVVERAADHHDQPHATIQALEEEIARLKACLADHAIQCPQCHAAILAALEGRA